MKTNYHHLSIDERREIYYMRHHHYSIRKIARLINRSHSTISRELKRNSGCWCEQYYHNPAQNMYQRRMYKRAQREPLKNKKTHDYIVAKILLGWTPQIISGCLKLKKSYEYVCHETIYQYIYKKHPALIEFLPRHHKKRKKKHPNRKYVSKIVSKTSILERPEHINDRSSIGHWESDSIVSMGRTCYLNVIVERATRLVHITKLRTSKSISTKRAIIKKLSQHPKEFVRSITYDNGPENALHLETNKALNCHSYFCQPYHSWEKGLVEQTNGLIRRFLPKKCDLSKCPVSGYEKIEKLLNSRPRKCLGYRTPFEVYNEMTGALSS